MIAQKDIKIQAGLDAEMALRALNRFIQEFNESHHGARKGVVMTFRYGGSDWAVYVYQTTTQYCVVRA